MLQMQITLPKNNINDVEYILSNFSNPRQLILQEEDEEGFFRTLSPICIGGGNSRNACGW